MQELKTPMADCYQKHPAFRGDVPSWSVSDDQLAAFNTTYAAVRQIGASLDDQSVAAFRRDCVQALSEIFSSMQAQVADEFEAHFLAELKIESVRLLDEELGWYVRSIQPRFVQLTNVAARHDSIRMQADRHFFGQLPLGAVEDIRRLAAKDLRQFRINATAGRLKREDLSVNSGRTVRAIRDVLNREFKALGVLDVISAYTGRKIRVLGLALELSVPQATWWRNSIAGLERPPQTLYAHLDETISCPKSIVYLSDVTAQNGPTGCYPGAYEAMQLNPLQEIIGRVVGIVGNRTGSPLNGYYAKQYHQSVNSENFRRHFMRLPECLRFNSHMGWDVLPGSELESRLAGNELKMTGPAGTFIAFDGARLLHRGGLIQEGERLALQVIFSDLTFTERAVGKVKRILS